MKHFVLFFSLFLVACNSDQEAGISSLEIPVAAKVATYEVPASLIAYVQNQEAVAPAGSERQNRWRRVLIAFGVATYDGLSAMSASEAQAFADRGPVWKDKWTPIAEALTQLESDGSQDSDDDQGSDDTQDTDTDTQDSDTNDQGSDDDQGSTDSQDTGTDTQGSDDTQDSQDDDQGSTDSQTTTQQDPPQDISDLDWCANGPSWLDLTTCVLAPQSFRREWTEWDNSGRNGQEPDWTPSTVVEVPATPVQGEPLQDPLDDFETAAQQDASVDEENSVCGTVDTGTTNALYIPTSARGIYGTYIEGDYHNVPICLEDPVGDDDPDLTITVTLTGKPSNPSTGDVVIAAGSRLTHYFFTTADDNLVGPDTEDVVFSFSASDNTVRTSNPNHKVLITEDDRAYLALETRRSLRKTKLTIWQPVQDAFRGTVLIRGHGRGDRNVTISAGAYEVEILPSNGTYVPDDSEMEDIWSRGPDHDYSYSGNTLQFDNVNVVSTPPSGGYMYWPGGDLNFSTVRVVVKESEGPQAWNRDRLIYTVNSVTVESDISGSGSWSGHPDGVIRRIYRFYAANTRRFDTKAAWNPTTELTSIPTSSSDGSLPVSDVKLYNPNLIKCGRDASAFPTNDDIRVCLESDFPPVQSGHNVLFWVLDSATSMSSQIHAQVTGIDNRESMRFTLGNLYHVDDGSAFTFTTNHSVVGGTGVFFKAYTPLNNYYNPDATLGPVPIQILPNHYTTKHIKRTGTHAHYR